MPDAPTSPARRALIWGALVMAIVTPVVAAGFSPLLAWRDPTYIVAGFAGVIGLAILLLQPLLAGKLLPGVSERRARQVHRLGGLLLVLSVLVHVGGLWITSPPDVVDVLLFRSPTPFAVWGVIAMWAVFAAALLAALRRRLRLRWRVWRLGHTALAVITVVGSVVHAMLIQGTMESVSKALLCLLVLAVTAKAMADLRVWAIRKRGHG